MTGVASLSQTLSLVIAMLAMIAAGLSKKRLEWRPPSPRRRRGLPWHRPR